MRPLVLRREVDAFVADRLLEALWREALWLVADDVATVEEVDDAIRFGAGLRWASMGTFLTYRIAGGEAGMRHFMEQFGPALQLPWTRLTDVPELTGELLDKLVAQSDAQAGGRDAARARAAARRLPRLGHAGAAHARLRRGRGARGARARAVRGGAGRAARPTRRRCGCTAPSSRRSGSTTTATRTRAATCRCSATRPTRCCATSGSTLGGGGSYYTVETHLSHLGQARAEERLHTTTQLLGHDEKRLHVFHSLYRTDDGALLATAEQMLLHVDTAAERVAPAPPELLERLARIAAAHAALPRPERAGRSIGSG